MTRGVSLLLLAMLLLPASAPAVPRPPAVRPDPRAVAAEPSYVRRVAPALVGLHVRAEAGTASSERLGTLRFATAVIFDPRGSPSRSATRCSTRGRSGPGCATAGKCRPA